MRLRLPDRGALPFLASAGAAWTGVLVGPAPWVVAAGVAGLLARVGVRRKVVVWVAAMLLAGTLAGAVHDAGTRSVLDAEFPAGPGVVDGVATTDLVETWGRPTFLLEVESIDGRSASAVARVEPDATR